MPGQAPSVWPEWRARSQAPRGPRLRGLARPKKTAALARCTTSTRQLADIVLLDANPLEDIKNTQTIWRVIKGGWLFDPEKLRPPESSKRAKQAPFAEARRKGLGS